MEVEVTPSAHGAFVPQFLLKFEGNTSLQNYFSDEFITDSADDDVLETETLDSDMDFDHNAPDDPVLEEESARQILKTNYYKGVVKLDFGHCQSCCMTLTYNDRPRMKPSQSMTRKVRKLLARSGNRPLGKHHAHLVHKYLSSSSQLTVRCISCGYINKRPVITNEEKLAQKDKLLQISEVVIEPALSLTKKKKKKRKRKEKDGNSGLIIPAKNFAQNKSLTEEATSLPVEVLPDSPLLPGRFSTPISTKREVSTNLGTSTKTPNNSTPAQNYFLKGASSTPMQRKLPGSLSKFGQMTSQQKTKKVEVKSPVLANRKMKHKQLQEFLSQESVAVQKPASLSDFLSSL